jgi:hypothetical protein
MSDSANNLLLWVATVIAIPAFGWMIVTIAGTQSRVAALEATTTSIVKTQERSLEWQDRMGELILETHGAVTQLTKAE